jgi:hypothetical protein
MFKGQGQTLNLMKTRWQVCRTFSTPLMGSLP